MKFTDENKKEHMAKIVCGNGCYIGLSPDNGPCVGCSHWDENVETVRQIIAVFPSALSVLEDE